jgi:N6-L-threonylcarbamoyladenine synthase
MIVLGIESSCDETSVAVLKENNILCNLISSQGVHKKFGGVVPELSSRAHLQLIHPLVKTALKESGIELKDIDLVAATAGPGLIGALLVGLTYAKGLAYSLSKPFVAVNHVEGHIYSGFLMPERPKFPYLCLVVSGGNTLLLIVESDTKIIKLGGTIDDAVGEAFDKVSKLIGLGYPGGPKIQEHAKAGNPNAVKFPISKTKNAMDFSFSGLKTAVLRYIQKEFPDGNIPYEKLCDIAASFQFTAIRSLTLNIEKALKNYKVNGISVVGGVAANSLLREEVLNLGKKYKIDTVIPKLEYCGDNAAMIAYRGQQLYLSGITHNFYYTAFPTFNF